MKKKIFFYFAHQIPKLPLLLDHTPDPHHPSTIPKPRMNEALSPCPQDKSATQPEPQGNEKPEPPQNPENVTLFCLFSNLQLTKKNLHKSPCPCKKWPPVLHPLKPKSRRPPRGRIQPSHSVRIKLKEHPHPMDAINQAPPIRAQNNAQTIET